MTSTGSTRATTVPLTLPRGGRRLTVTSADGTALNTRIFGPEDAPTIVFVHGYTQEMRTWSYQVRDLADRFRIVVFDQRGHGKSGWAPPRTYTVAALGDDLDAIVEACVPHGERALLVGHSMGAVAVMSWADRHPDTVAQRAAAVLLANTVASKLARHAPWIRHLPPARLALPIVARRRILTIVQRGARRPLRRIALGPDARAEHLDAILEMIQGTPAPTLRHFLRSLFSMNLVPELHKLAVPTILVGGRDDRATPPIHTANLNNALPDVRQVVMLAGSGHMSHWEESEIFSALVTAAARTFLSRDQNTR